MELGWTILGVRFCTLNHLQLDTSGLGVDAMQNTQTVRHERQHLFHPHDLLNAAILQRISSSWHAHIYVTRYLAEVRILLSLKDHWQFCMQRYPAYSALPLCQQKGDLNSIFAEPQLPLNGFKSPDAICPHPIDIPPFTVFG